MAVNWETAVKKFQFVQIIYQGILTNLKCGCITHQCYPCFNKSFFLMVDFKICSPVDNPLGRCT